MPHSYCTYFKMCHVNVSGMCGRNGLILGRLEILYWGESALMLLKDGEMALKYSKLKCKNDSPPLLGLCSFLRHLVVGFIL